MRRPDGYFISVDPDPRRGQAAVREADTCWCRHCGGHFFVKPMCDPADAGGFCSLCATPICAKCAAKPGCEPFEKQMEQMEAKARLRREL